MKILGAAIEIGICIPGVALYKRGATPNRNVTLTSTAIHARIRTSWRG